LISFVLIGLALKVGTDPEAGFGPVEMEILGITIT